MNALRKYKILVLIIIFAFFSKGYGQTYKYKVKWDLKRSMGASDLFFYLNTGDTYPYNGNYANAATNSVGNFSYILSNSSVSSLDGVVVSSSPLRLTQAVKEPSGSFTQRSGSFVSGPESGYWQNNFGSPLNGNMVTHNTPLEFYYLYTLEKNNVVITEKAALTFQLFKTDAQCHDQNGSVRIEAWGGIAPYYYTIDSGSEVELTSTTNIINISGGTHYTKVRNKSNCIDLTANDSI